MFQVNNIFKKLKIYQINNIIEKQIILITINKNWSYTVMMLNYICKCKYTVVSENHAKIQI